MFTNKNLFPLIFAIGAIILVVGLVFSYYPNSVIAGLQGRLYSGTEQEQWMYQGSLNWWQIEQLTVYQPISYLLIISGVIVMIYSVLSKIFSIASSSTNKKTNI